MNLYEETRFLMKKFNISANKGLGQNFLIDDEVVEKIVDASCITSGDLVIEIGPGLGTLTSKLLECAGKVICIELDNRMINVLKERFKAYNNFDIINKDVLKVNLQELIQKEKTGKIKNAKIVANLPYYITTPIIMKLLEERLDIESITVMVQKEVAERLIAKPGTNLSGAITYAISYYTEPEKIIDVSKEAFLPAPKVDSMVIKLNVLKEHTVKVVNEEKMFEIIKLAFMQRRKTLINSLANSGKMGSKEQIEETIEKIGLDKKIRGENLTLEDFAKLADY